MGKIELIASSWRRLSKEGIESERFILSNGTTFKIGTTSTFVAQKLNNQKNAFPKPLDFNNKKGDCIVCCENERDSLLLPCKHNAMCLKCSKPLKECPICKIKIEEIIRIYKC